MLVEDEAKVPVRGGIRYRDREGKWFREEGVGHLRGGRVEADDFCFSGSCPDGKPPRHRPFMKCFQGSAYLVAVFQCDGNVVCK